MTDKDSHDQDATFAETARQRAIEAYDSARDGVADVGRKATGTLKEAPLIALAGVAAAGALIAAVLPRTRVETEALRPTVRRDQHTRLVGPLVRGRLEDDTGAGLPHRHSRGGLGDHGSQTA